jgi:homospermidine synthase
MLKRTGRRKGCNQPNVDLKDPWQFKNFLITNAEK